MVNSICIRITCYFSLNSDWNISFYDNIKNVCMDVCISSLFLIIWMKNNGIKSRKNIDLASIDWCFPSWFHIQI